MDGESEDLNVVLMCSIYVEFLTRLWRERVLNNS